MYQISEPALNRLIQESQSVSERLVLGGNVSKNELLRFGKAIMAVQTEVTTGEPFSEAAYLPAEFVTNKPVTKQIAQDTGDAIACHACGGIMQRAGSCYSCPNCGSTSGCS